MDNKKDLEDSKLIKEIIDDNNNCYICNIKIKNMDKHLLTKTHIKKRDKKNN
jgi:hypothetical protein